MKRESMPTVRCPLSQSDEVELLECISVKELDKLYIRLYGNSISRLFKGHANIEMWRSKESGLIWFEPMVAGDETFYNALQKFKWYYADHKNEFDIAAKFINPLDRILEVGSGRGNFAKFLQMESYTGLDFSHKARELAALDGIDVRVEDLLHHAKFNEEMYDVVCAFQVLEHVPNIKDFLLAMTKCLRKNGKIIIAVPSQDSYLSIANNLALNLPPHHLSRYTDKAIMSFSKYIPVKLIHLEHDPLQQVHFNDYIYQITISSLRNLLNINYKSVDNRWQNYALRIPGVLLRKLLSKGLNHPGLPNGHTITAIFEKL